MVQKILELIDFPKEFQEDSAFFIADGRSHFCAAYRLMLFPALDINGVPLRKNDGTIFMPFEYLRSALIIFQFSFELLLKSLIKLKEKQPPRTGKKGHNLPNLWKLAEIDFPALRSIQKKDLGVLVEISSIREADSNLMRLKYGKSRLSLPEGGTPLLESFSRIYQLLNREIQAFVSLKSDTKESEHVQPSPSL